MWSGSASAEGTGDSRIDFQALTEMHSRERVCQLLRAPPDGVRVRNVKSLALLAQELAAINLFVTCGCIGASRFDLPTSRFYAAQVSQLRA